VAARGLGKQKIRTWEKRKQRKGSRRKRSLRVVAQRSESCKPPEGEGGDEVAFKGGRVKPARCVADSGHSEVGHACCTVSEGRDPLEFKYEGKKEKKTEP